MHRNNICTLRELDQNFTDVVSCVQKSANRFLDYIP